MIDEARNEALNVLEETVRYGSRAVEVALSYLPDDLSYIVPQIRGTFINFANRYRKSREVSLLDLVEEYGNIPKTEILLRYIILSSSVATAVERPKYDLIYSTIRDAYDELLPFLERPTWRGGARKTLNMFGDGIGGARRDELGTALSNFVNSTTRFAKPVLYKRIALIGKYRNLKDFLRGGFMTDNASLHRTKMLGLLTRIIGHETNIPFAGKIILRKEYLKYDPVVDMYTALVALRSGGAFLAVDDDRTKRVLNALKQGSAAFKMRKVVPLVRDTVRLARDPMLYEKGASDIGRNYCSKLMCGECPPIRHVCKRFTSIEVR